MHATVLAIESSCDETAVALVTQEKKVLVSLVRSQHEQHARFGGVVPNLAARAHGEVLDAMIKEALDEAGLTARALAGIAATTGPGLVGGLLIGASYAKGLAIGAGVPFYAVNHLAAHALSVRLCADVPFPYLMLLVSGGHTQLVVAESPLNYHVLGTTLDDAAGEAFDKTASLLGLGFPGGRQLEECAQTGDSNAIRLPLPLRQREGYDFSFSGLKNAVRLQVQANERPSPQHRADIAASFQATAARHLARQTQRAVMMARQQWPSLTHLCVAGGVACNSSVRNALQAVANDAGLQWLAPPLWLCGDNAAMIAWAALERREIHEERDALDEPCRPRWPLDSLTKR